jgi:cysteine desulfurase
VDKICSIEQVRLNGDPIKRFDGCLNFSFTGVGSDGLMISLKKFAVSSGSACSSESLEPSYVLRALNLDTATANSAIRIGLNRFTREWEVVSFFQAIT